MPKRFGYLQLLRFSLRNTRDEFCTNGVNVGSLIRFGKSLKSPIINRSCSLVFCNRESTHLPAISLCLYLICLADIFNASVESYLDEDLKCTTMIVQSKLPFFALNTNPGRFRMGSTAIGRYSYELSTDTDGLYKTATF